MICVTVRSMVSALAPGYTALIATWGGAISGYAAAGRRVMARPPPTMMRMAMTQASTGRSMK